MVGASPAIACIGVIGKQNNPLHISLFPPGQRPALEFQFLLSSSLDIFETQAPHKTDQDFGLLQCIDENLSTYGWLTNTGVKFVIIVDMEGRPADPENRTSAVLGLRNEDLKPAFRALHTAYIGLLRNPFYEPDEHTPLYANAHRRVGSTQITDRRFIKEVARIGETWAVGVTNL